MIKENNTYCVNCGNAIYRTSWELTRCKFHYCSKQCQMDYKRKIKFYDKENNPNYKGGLVEVKCTLCNTTLLRKQTFVRKFNRFFCSSKCRGQWISKNLNGENSWSWQDGKTNLVASIRTISAYNDWRVAIFKKDNFKCHFCGDVHIQAHHIQSISSILKEFKIKILEDAKSCEKLWSIENGITMCKKCHKAFHKSYGLKKCNYDNINEFKTIRNG